MRKSGIDLIGPVPWGTHFCQFYETGRDLLDILVPYFKQALEDNEYCMWVTSEPLHAEEARAALHAAVPHLDDHLRRGQIEILDYRQWYTATGRFEADRVLQGWVERERRALEQGFAGLRLTGNAFWLEKKDWRDFADYEASANRLLKDHRIIALCTYAVQQCGAFELIEVVNNHQFALIRHADKWEVMASGEHKRTEEALQAMLRESRQRQAEVSALLEGSRAILEHHEFADAARLIFDACKQLLGASSGYIALLDGSGTENEVVFLESGGLSCTVDTTLPMPIRGLRETVYRSGKAAYENDFSHSHWVRFLPPGHVGLVNVLFAPLSVGQKVVGLLGVANKAGGFSDDDARMASTFGELAAIALRNSRTLELLEHSEQRFRSVAQSANDAILSADSSGNVIYCNQSAEKMFGYSAEEITGKPLTILMPEPVRQRHQAALQRVVSLGEAKMIGRTVEVVGRHSDGREFPIELSLATWRAKEGVFFTGVLRDITERKRAEAALREADRRKDEFLATLAHELRNPLAPIRNALELIRLRADKPAAVEGARRIAERQLQQLVRLVDDLLDLSRISRGQIELRKQRVELSAVINSAIETAGPQIDTGNHQLTVTLPAGPLWLEADLTRLAQAVANLLINAAKYTEPCGRIHLRCRGVDHEVLIEVEDNGIGIPPEMLPRVFDMFTQVDRLRERGEGGLGIGLTLVKQLVEMHGGGVLAASAGPGKGSTFTIRLPLSGHARPQPTTIGPPRAFATAAPARRRILVVDDNVDSASTLAEILEVLGHEAQTAHDGFHALQRALAYRPEVVLLDIGMPGMSGYEVARRLRAQPQTAAAILIALTGFGQDEDRQQALQAGFDHHLVKPVDPHVLQGLLSQAQ